MSCGINTAEGACPNEAGEHGITVTRNVDGQMVANRTPICDEHYLLLRATMPSARS